MAKDSKKENPNKESKIEPKDKNIHLNVVGVPKKNVDVKKTYPRQNDEEYQLYRISIDTKGKHNDRKHRMSSLEPSSKKPKARKRHKSYDNDIVSSNDSDTDIYRPQKRKNSGGQKEKPSTPKSRMKGDVDSEICFTIPGEKGKAIRIVGSSTKARDDSLPRESSPQPKRTKQDKPESHRQVGFSRLDEVYGSTPEDTSFTSRDSSPYRQDSPQVYKMENSSPNSAFKDPTNSSNVPGKSADRGNDQNLEKTLSPPIRTSHPNNKLEEQSKPSMRSSQASSPLSKSPKEGQDRQPQNKEPHADAPKPRSDKLSTSKDDEEVPGPSPNKQPALTRPRSGHKSMNETSSTLPSSSYVSSNYDLSLASTSDSKGKYPFYPYDKQKRGKSPSNQLQEPKHVKQEDRESYTNQKLPSIPEVRSTEHYPSPHPSGSEEVSLPPKESSVGWITRPNAYSGKTSPEPLSPNEKNVAKIQHSSNSLPNTKNDISGNKPISHDLSKSSQMQKPSRTVLSHPQRDTLRDNPILYGTPKENQPQRPLQNISQSTSTVTSKIQKKGASPVVQNYNVQNTPSQLEVPSTNKGEVQNKPQGPGTKARYSPYNMKNTLSQQETLSTNKRELENKPQGLAPGIKERSLPYNMKNTPSQQEPPSTNKRELQNKPQGPTPDIMARSSPLQETVNKLQNVEITREPTFKKGQAAVNNKTSIINKHPITIDKETMTDRPLSPKEKIIKEISEELLRNSSSFHQKSLPGSAKRDDSSHEKDSKRTKSKLSSFVSSIPKPSFRRNKSLEKKSTDKSVISNKNQPKLSSLEKNVKLTGGKVNVNDKARKPVEESAIVKQAHKPVVEAYPDWVTSPDQQQPEQGGNDFQPQRFKDSPLSERIPLKSSKEYLPFGMDDSSSVEIANRSYGEHPLAGRDSTAPSVHEQTSRPLLIVSKEGGSANSLRHQNEMSKAADWPKEAWKRPYNEKGKQLQDSHSNASSQYDSERTKDPDYNNYGKDKSIYQGPNVVAYPGQITEKNPFDYEFKNEGPNEENQAMKSLQDAFEADKRQRKNLLDLPTRSVDRNPSLVSRASRNPEEELKNKYYGRPIQVLKGSADSQLSSDKITPREISYDPNKNFQSTDRGFGRGKRTANESPVTTGSMSRLKHTPTSLDGEETKVKPVSKNPFGKTPEEQVQVYLSNNPDDFNAFNPQYSNDEVSPYKGKSKPPTNERQGPKGILIFVNKKNETANPFQKSSPSRKGEDSSTKPKGTSDQKKKIKKKTSSSGDTTASSSMQSSSLYASGDKKSMVERTPSGSKITETYPCGCIRILKTDPSNALKKEEIISAYCKDGSKCEVGKKQRTMLGRSADSSSMSWEGSRPGRGMLPEIEVIADGVVSKKPINSRTPAPTMNGAKLTGTFKIKSNKVNGVCNLYLDKKLKNYLRNNMDKLKLLLEDDDKR